MVYELYCVINTFQASYCLEVRRNGVCVNEYYIPRADYHLVIEGSTLPIVSFPKLPVSSRFVCLKFLELQLFIYLFLNCNIINYYLSVLVF